MPLYTTARKIKHPLQSFVETVEGTFPSSGSGTAYPFASLEFDIDGQYVDVGQVGPEDLLALIRGVKISRFRITAPLTVDTWGLLSWLCKKLDFDSPSGTPAESRSFVFSIRFDTSVNYIKMVGVKPISGSVKIEHGKPHELEIEFGCVDILDPTTTAPTGVTLATAFPSGTVYHARNAALSFNGQSVTFKTLTMNVNRGTEDEPVAGSDLPFGLQAFTLDVAGEFTALWGLNSSLLTDFNGDTGANMVITFNSGKTITFSAKLTRKKSSIDQKSTNAVPEVWNFKYISGMNVAA